MGAINLSSPENFTDTPPEEVDVLVVGGGVIGVATAYFLCERGLRVAVCEKGRVAGEHHQLRRSVFSASMGKCTICFASADICCGQRIIESCVAAPLRRGKRWPVFNEIERWFREVIGFASAGLS